MVSRLLLTALLASPLAAQETADVPANERPPTAERAERPKVALVLSGGGARGSAHIGVIKVLEELNIPIDFVTGTSMGAVVGGLYASGLSIEEIENEMLAVDWEDVFDDEPNRRDLTFRRKQDESTYQIDPNVGWSDGRIKLPSGVIQGQKLNLLLKEFTLHAFGTTDFDDLPIPFRAVAGDISTGEMVVLDHGDLATAIRSSMSIPGLIAPVTIDGRELVDGLVANNLPIDVAKDWGADIVIAVNVGRPLQDLSRQASFLNVSSQVLTILMGRNVDERLALLDDDDLLLRPGLEGIGPSDFAEAAAGIRAGEQVARENHAELARLSVSESEYWEIRKRQLRGAYTLPLIRHIRIETDAHLHQNAIRTHLSAKPGEPLDIDRLKDDIGRIYGMNIFELVDFRLEADSGGTDLIVDAREKEWGPTYLRFRAFLTDDFDGSATYQLGTRITYLPLNNKGAEWRNEIELGDLMRFSTEFFQPLNPGSPYFIAPRLEYIKTDVEAFSGGQAVAELEISAFNLGIDIGRLLGNWGEFRVGLAHTDANIEIETGPVGFDPGEIEETRILMGLLVDTLDDNNFPRKGQFGGAFLIAADEELGAEDDFESLETSANQVVSFGPNTLIFGANYATGLNDNNTAVDQFALGGFLNLSGLEFNSIRGNHRLLLRTFGYRQLGYEKRTPFGIPYYLGGSVELGNVYDDRDDIDLESMLLSGSVFLGMDTFIGPIYVGYGLTEGGEQAAFLFVGGLPL